MIGGPPIAAGSYITATAAAKADSSGRRNGLCVCTPYLAYQALRLAFSSQVSCVVSD